jgi:hypothetical protein
LSITCGYHHHSAIHKSSTSDHVLDVVGVTGTIDMRIVASFGLVFDMCRRDSDTTFPLLGSFIDGSIFQELCPALFCLSLGDGGG